MALTQKKPASQTIAPRKSVSERLKFKYLNGEPAENFKKFENVTPGINNEQDGMACNGKLTAVNWSSASSIAVFGAYDYKRFDNNVPLIKGHKGAITDLQWSPFEDRLLASSSDDATIKLWFIENEKGITEHVTVPASSMEEHAKKCKAI